MICKNCGTDLADKALICYRCGTAIAEPRLKPPPTRSDARVSVAYGVLAVLLLTLVALFAWPSASGAPPETLVWITTAAVAVVLAWRVFAGRRRPGR